MPNKRIIRLKSSDFCATMRTPAEAALLRSNPGHCGCTRERMASTKPEVPSPPRVGSRNGAIQTNDQATARSGRSRSEAAARAGRWRVSPRRRLVRAAGCGVSPFGGSQGRTLGHGRNGRRIGRERRCPAIQTEKGPHAHAGPEREELERSSGLQLSFSRASSFPDSSWPPAS
jgi:hypothetical protein